jgi:hypothetical protein
MFVPSRCSVALAGLQNAFVFVLDKFILQCTYSIVHNGRETH